MPFEIKKPSLCCKTVLKLFLLHTGIIFSHSALNMRDEQSYERLEQYSFMAISRFFIVPLPLLGVTEDTSSINCAVGTSWAFGKGCLTCLWIAWLSNTVLGCMNVTATPFSAHLPLWKSYLRFSKVFKWELKFQPNLVVILKSYLSSDRGKTCTWYESKSSNWAIAKWSSVCAPGV